MGHYRGAGPGGHDWRIDKVSSYRGIGRLAGNFANYLIKNGNLARPERFELPTNWFEASYSIQLSYGRVDGGLYRLFRGISPFAQYLLKPESNRAT